MSIIEHNDDLVSDVLDRVLMITSFLEDVLTVGGKNRAVEFSPKGLDGLNLIVQEISAAVRHASHLAEQEEKSR